MHTRSALLISALLLTGLVSGCQNMNGGEATPRNTPATAGELCIMQNPTLKNDSIIGAMEVGLKALGFETKVVPPESKPDVCRHTMGFALVTTEDQKKFDKILFVDFYDGVQHKTAAGPADENGEFPLKLIANYAAAFAKHMLEPDVPVNQTAQAAQ